MLIGWFYIWMFFCFGCYSIVVKIGWFLENDEFILYGW